MIVVEGRLWPVVFIGAVDDASAVPRDACIVTDELLVLSERLVLGAVVSGRGDAGVRSQHAVLNWLESRKALVRSRALRLAWVIEDDRIRGCTNAWLGCMGQTVFAVQSVTFRTVHTALSWLLDTPWPVGSRPTAVDGPSVDAPTVPASRSAPLDAVANSPDPFTDVFSSDGHSDSKWNPRDHPVAFR